jgi:hypothetical protein
MSVWRALTPSRKRLGLTPSTNRSPALLLELVNARHTDI